MEENSIKNNIQKSFDSTLTNSNLESLGIDLAELTIDSVLNDGLVKDIPIVSTLINISKVGANIHDRLFLKKIISFLNGLNDVLAEKRKKMIYDIDSSKKYRVKVGEKLLYIIDACDDYEISELIGLLFKGYIEEKMTFSEFLKTAKVLENITINDFNWFLKNGQSSLDLDGVGDLINSGLFELHYEQVDVRVEDEDDYKKLREGYSSKYKTEVDGGGVSVFLSRAGEVILEIFSVDYKKPKVKKL